MWWSHQTMKTLSSRTSAWWSVTHSGTFSCTQKMTLRCRRYPSPAAPFQSLHQSLGMLIQVISFHSWSVIRYSAINWLSLFSYFHLVPVLQSFFHLHCIAPPPPPPPHSSLRCFRKKLHVILLSFYSVVIDLFWFLTQFRCTIWLCYSSYTGIKLKLQAFLSKPLSLQLHAKTSKSSVTSVSQFCACD